MNTREDVILELVRKYGCHYIGIYHPEINCWATLTPTVFRSELLMHQWGSIIYLTANIFTIEDFRRDFYNNKLILVKIQDRVPNFLDTIPFDAYFYNIVLSNFNEAV